MKIEEITYCDLCGHDEFEVVWDKTERRKGNRLNSIVIEDNGEIINGTSVMCKKCGLVFINPRMTEEATEEYYEKQYRENYTTDERGELYHANMAVKYLVDNRQVVKLTKDKNYSLLDVGCSTGKFLDAMKSDNVICYGVEQCEATADIAGKNHMIFNNRIEDIVNIVVDYNLKPELINEYGYDIVSIFNTLEHMHSPTRTLNKIRDIMTDDGFLFVIVPNLYNDNLLLPSDAFMSNAHLFQFDDITLQLYFKKCGFEPICMNRIPEFNMDKLYAIVKKCKPVELDIKHKVNPDYIKHRLEAMNAVAIVNYEFRKAMGAYE